MRCETHVYVGLDKDENPVAAFRTLQAARKAVASDGYRFGKVVDYWPDVPLNVEGEPNA